MRVLSHIYRWLLSVSVALAISCILYSGVSLIDEYFRLRLAANDDPRLLAFLAFPIILPLIHWLLHKRSTAWRALLITGLLLTSAGGAVYLLGREANAHHVSMGPFSGLEYALQMAAGIFFASVGGLFILVWGFSIPFRGGRIRCKSGDNTDSGE